jgi:DNA-binding MarR family transcriptional regulator
VEIELMTENSMSANIAQLLEATARAVYDRRGPREMHPGQWAILRYLAQMEPRAPKCSEIGAHLGTTHAPVSRAIASLVRKGLVLPAADDRDRRITRVHLTSSGRDTLEIDPLQRLRIAIRQLPEPEQHRLGDGLASILSSLNEQTRTSARPSRAAR